MTFFTSSVNGRSKSTTKKGRDAQKHPGPTIIGQK
jgi:hypothetical protein